MEDFYTIPEEYLRYTARAVRSEMLKRGWGEAKVMRSTKHLLIFAKRADGKQIRFCSCFPDKTSVFASILADDKMATYALFEKEKIPQPATVRLSVDEEEMRGQLADFVAKYPRVVVKPIDGAHGRGVVTGITDEAQALKAAKACGCGNALIQEQLPDDITEIRAICVDGKFITAFKRIPAMVTGDGKHTISELIEKENNEIRKEAYQGQLALIDVAGAKDYIRKKKIDANRVPEEGENVRVMAMCNIGMGGTVEEVELSPEQIALSEKIAALTELPTIGIDFYGDKVIEINAGPSLYYPTGDESADKCVKAYVDYLENI